MWISANYQIRYYDEYFQKVSLLAGNETIILSFENIPGIYSPF